MIQCNRCHLDGLEWDKEYHNTHQKWRLIDDNGRPHICRESNSSFLSTTARNVASRFTSILGIGKSLENPVRSVI